MKKTLILFTLLTAGGRAQEPMLLREAVRAALAQNKSMEASSAATEATASRIAEARASLLPSINYSESWTRSDNPVFVFSSLLTQHQFGSENFQIGPLNRPEFLNNFQSQLSADQVLYDAGRARRGVRAAELAHSMSREDARRTAMTLIAQVVRAYCDVQLSSNQLAVTAQAISSAESDLGRAEARRSAGWTTDADVLSVRVHLAGVREQQIRRAADLEVARAALNDFLGLPLDTLHDIPAALTPLPIPVDSLAEYENRGSSERPEARQARLASRLSEMQAADARSSLMPQVDLHGAVEADRQRFYDRGGANWLVSIGLRWNLFHGFSDKARIAETKSSLHRTIAEGQRADSAIRLQVRRAYADLRAAQQRIETERAAVGAAEESLRIFQDRYEAGLSTITDLLLTETALLEARMRHLAAIHDQRIAAAALELAAGTLNADSEVLN